MSTMVIFVFQIAVSTQNHIYLPKPKNLKDDYGLLLLTILSDYNFIHIHIVYNIPLHFRASLNTEQAVIISDVYLFIYRVISILVSHHRFTAYACSTTQHATKLRKPTNEQRRPI